MAHSGDSPASGPARSPHCQADPTGRRPWPLCSVLELGALPSAPGCARRYAKCLLREWNLAALTDEVELLVSELVTNAIAATEGLHTLIRPPVRLRLLSDRRRVVIEVWDASVRPPVRTDANLTASYGRGLLLVDMVSERWAWTLTPQRGGKVVWCEIRVPV